MSETLQPSVSPSSEYLSFERVLPTRSAQGCVPQGTEALTPFHCAAQVSRVDNEMANQKGPLINVAVGSSVVDSSCLPPPRLVNLSDHISSVLLRILCLVFAYPFISFLKLFVLR